jgi:hypothetical protein
MSDDVVISNLAVSRLGDAATISSIDPPEGSRQAEHCAQFLPISRRTLLEMHPWDFATSSVALALQEETVRGWQYAYARPSGCLKVHAVLPPNAGDDYSLAGAARQTMQSADGTIFSPIASGFNNYIPQPFKAEKSRTTGTKLILTNQEEAEAICTFDEEDYSVFSPLAVDSLAWLLAANIAGPIYKGKSGIEISQLMMQKFMALFAKATESNASQEYMDVRVSTPWMNGR